MNEGEFYLLACGSVVTSLSLGYMYGRPLGWLAFGCCFFVGFIAEVMLNFLRRK